MSLRLPQNLTTQLAPPTGMSVLEVQILAEKAASLGDAGRAVARALVALREAPATPSDIRTALVRKAADVAWMFLVQRELCGLFDWAQVVTDYAIPAEVLALLGARI